MYGFLLLCYSNFIPKIFTRMIFDFKNAETFKSGSGSKVVPFNRLSMVSCYCPIVTLSVFEIFVIKNDVTLKPR